MVDYVAVKTELDAGHPVTGAYNVDDQLAADEINTLNVVRDMEHIAVALMFDEILRERVEWDSLNTIDQQWVRDILNINETLGVPTLAGTPARTELVNILGSNTKAAIAAIIPETVSQATVIGEGFIIIGDIQNARDII